MFSTPLLALPRTNVRKKPYLQRLYNLTEGNANYRPTQLGQGSAALSNLTPYNFFTGRTLRLSRGVS